MDVRTAMPRPYLAFYPAIYPQASLEESINLLHPTGSSVASSTPAGHPPKHEPIEPRQSYDAVSPVDLASFGPTRPIRLGDIALARSGDKGANINLGIFVRSAAQWEWFRAFMSRERMRGLLGEDDDDGGFYIERIEFPNLWAVHFVVYGILGRGVSSSTKLDCLGKGFADYIRDKVVEVPERVLGGVRL
ncbi:hypothetical protein FQN55_004922 [Onygenales sp. PD_40]|nr:hypothetical protein FQN55_004922 [Onygenales sp. PD_40]